MVRAKPSPLPKKANKQEELLVAQNLAQAITDVVANAFYLGAISGGSKFENLAKLIDSAEKQLVCLNSIFSTIKVERGK